MRLQGKTAMVTGAARHPAERVGIADIGGRSLPTRPLSRPPRSAAASPCLRSGMNTAMDQICAEYENEELELLDGFLRQTAAAAGPPPKGSPATASEVLSEALFHGRIDRYFMAVTIVTNRTAMVSTRRTRCGPSRSFRMASAVRCLPECL